MDISKSLDELNSLKHGELSKIGAIATRILTVQDVKELQNQAMDFVKERTLDATSRFKNYNNEVDYRRCLGVLTYNRIKERISMN